MIDDVFYTAFEARHRGPRELVKARLAVYLPFIWGLSGERTPLQALDLGCGRGEWLELLAEWDVQARGVDLDPRMIASCHELKLDAAPCDALQALRNAADASLDIVSAFQLVEHLPFDVVRELVAESLRVLRPGGLLILETPNPENVVVGASRFYLDPTHLRPLPPELLSFVVEFAGFSRQKTLRLQESLDAQAALSPSLLDVLAGVSPDYSVVAQKQGAEALHKALDYSFGRDYGLDLETLAERYRVNNDLRISRAESESAQLRSELVKLRSELVKLHSELVKLHSEQQSMVASRSWRWTAPLRTITRRLRRLRDGPRLTLNLSMRPILINLLRRLGLYALARRGYHAMRGASACPAPDQPPDAAALSPRAAAIRARLESAFGRSRSESA